MPHRSRRPSGRKSVAFHMERATLQTFFARERFLALLAEHGTDAMLLLLLMGHHLPCDLSLLYMRDHEAADLRCPTAGHDHRWHTGW